MRFLVIVCLIVLSLCFGKSKNDVEQRNFSNVEIETLLKDSLLNVRAIEVVDTLGLVYLTSKGDLGAIVNEEIGSDQQSELPKFFEVSLKTDSITPNFRSLAITSNNGYGVSIGSPALVYSLDIDFEKKQNRLSGISPKSIL